MGYQLWISSVTGHRRKGTEFSSLKKIFIDSITAKNFFEPLLCCPADSEADDARHDLKARGFDIAGVKETESSEVTGYVSAAELQAGKVRKYTKTITPSILISDSTPISDIVNALLPRDFVFVLCGNCIAGIITKADINKPPVRMYLFGMISLLEMHLNAYIRRYFDCDALEKRLPENRRKRAREMYDKQKGSSEDLSLLDCLQLCDKRDLLAKCDQFIPEIGFPKKEFIVFVKRIENVRNNLAHSRDSVTSTLNWSDFVETLSRVEEFLTKSDSRLEQTASKLREDFKDTLI